MVCKGNTVCFVSNHTFCSAVRSLACATAREQNDGEEIDAPPLGQLVWNPLRAGPVPDRAMARGEATGRVDEDDPALSDEGSDDSEEEITEEEVTEEEETGQRERGRRSAHWAGGAIGSADNDTRRRPWEEETHRHATRSLSPVDGRSRTRSRAATDVAEADGGGVQSARRVSSALPEQARRREAAAGWFGRVNGNTAGGGHLEAARAAADEGVPSAERLVASILQASTHYCAGCRQNTGVCSKSTIYCCGSFTLGCGNCCAVACASIPLPFEGSQSRKTSRAKETPPPLPFFCLSCCFECFAEARG